MTNDYKVNLLNYFTDNLEIETGVNAPQFDEVGYVGKNIKAYLNEQFEYGVFIIKKLKYSDSQYGLYYGNYYGDEDHHTLNGYILITDNNLEPVQLITQFSSGTTLKSIKSLNIDEEGYIYGIDEEYFYDREKLYDNFRFIMLNKILTSSALTGEFTVTLRTSYYIPSNILSNVFNVNECKKQIGTSNYFIFIQTPNSNPGILALTVNVGASNEWKLTETNLISYWSSAVMYFDYSETNLKIIIGAPITLSISGEQIFYNYREVVYEFASTPSFSEYKTIQRPSLLNNDCILTETAKMGAENTYIAYYYDDEDNLTSTFYLFKINYDTNAMELIYQLEKPHYFVGFLIEFYIIETELFLKLNWFISEDDDKELDGSISLIIDKNLYTISQETINYDYYTSQLYIEKTYNLYNIYYDVNDNKAKKIQLVYNPNNYNGLSYSDTNMLVPNSGQLYDDDSSLIFARNLYNKVVEDNMTVSTIQIPNTLLNGVNIANERLFGQTNLILNNESVSLSKNVYEYLNINFYNTLQMVNRNTSEDIINQTGASRINDSISQTTDYDDATMNKARVNYGDGTNYIFSIYFSQNGNDMETTFSVYAEKEILSIDLISNDETTVYNTITGEFTVGNYYTITQGVTVEGVEL